MRNSAEADMPRIFARHVISYPLKNGMSLKKRTGIKNPKNTEKSEKIRYLTTVSKFVTMIRKLNFKI